MNHSRSTSHDHWARRLLWGTALTVTVISGAVALGHQDIGASGGTPHDAAYTASAHRHGKWSSVTAGPARRSAADRYTRSAPGPAPSSAVAGAAPSASSGAPADLPASSAAVPAAPRTSPSAAAVAPPVPRPVPAPAAPAAPRPAGVTAPTSKTAPGPGTVGSTSGAGGYEYVQDFATDVGLGSWPGNGSAPNAYPGFVSYADGTGGKYYPSKVVSVHDGVMDWYCHSSMAAAVLPFGYDGFTYGTYTVRMRTDDFPSYHVAFLLWPNTDKWTHEVDGPEQETSSDRPYPAVLQTTSPSVSFAPGQSTSVPKSWHDPEFHDYTWQWTPDSLTFFQDGVKVTTVTGNVPRQAMHPVLQVEFSNTMGEGQKPDPSISGHVYVDRVAYDQDYTMAVPRS